MRGKSFKNFKHLTAFILLALTEGELHGGGLHSKLCDEIPNFNIDTAAVYRCLQNLEKEGVVEFYWNTSESGPAKKIYKLTSVGWDELGWWEEDIKRRVENLNYFLKKYNSVISKGETQND